MIGDNSDGGECYRGFFTNHYQDYVLEFEVRLIEGSLQLSPRTMSQSGRISDESSPALEFSEDTGVRQGRWTKITVTVNGDQVEAEIDGASPIVMDSETSRLITQGGPAFRLPGNSRAEIRKVRTKLVNSTRDGPF